MRFPAKMLQTERFVLRAAQSAYAHNLFDAVVESKADLATHFSWAQTPTLAGTFTDVEGMAAVWAQSHMLTVTTPTRFTYFIHDATDDTFLGVISLSVTDVWVPTVELGYWIRTSAQGRGIATEAARELVRHALEDLNTPRVQIRCNKLNKSSARIARKLGFRQEGILRQSYRGPDGKLMDMKIFSKLA
ncbi:MAG: GNAT family N-acetyltransferase [Proteobacteria bacterium]|nr:GNAT family N-acetyltransferase [Pseudomonadota bacterium]